MDKVGCYKIIPNLNLVVEYYSGTIQIDDIMLLKNHICQEKEYNSNYNLIHDFRNAYFDMTENDLYRHLDY